MPAGINVPVNVLDQVSVCYDEVEGGLFLVYVYDIIFGAVTLFFHQFLHHAAFPYPSLPGENNQHAFAKD